MSTPTQAKPATIKPANRIGLDYEAEARQLGAPPVPIIDAHSHINGTEAVRIFKRAADLYGVEQIWSMTHLEQVEAVREVLGDRIHFIAVPNFMAEDKKHALGDGFLDRIEKFHALGSKIVKLWAAPRGLDYAEEWGDRSAMRLDAPVRVRAMELATSLGMIIMTHIADPDTWFQTKYSDATKYGTKREQYIVLEEMLERYPQPWIAAHMGGWPEDLEFITGLLQRHDNLYLDTSATKWMIRELSKHSRDELLTFLTRFRGRLLFGSDTVTSDQHLKDADDNEMAKKASGPREAFDLYASRYWALRHLWETDYDGESPIADPDLHLVNPQKFQPLDAPPLRGKSIPADLLRDLYHNAAAKLMAQISD